jgi:hypothetical protein
LPLNYRYSADEKQGYSIVHDFDSSQSDEIIFIDHFRKTVKHVFKSHFDMAVMAILIVPIFFSNFFADIFVIAFAKNKIEIDCSNQILTV